jgi:hypothetical protein
MPCSGPIGRVANRTPSPIGAENGNRQSEKAIGICLSGESIKRRVKDAQEDVRGMAFDQNFYGQVRILNCNF